VCPALRRASWHAPQVGQKDNACGGAPSKGQCSARAASSHLPSSPLPMQRVGCPSCGMPWPTPQQGAQLSARGLPTAVGALARSARIF
jgi:hypothetical protein